MKHRRIVFLDIDGVLAHAGSNERLDPVCVGLLDELLATTGAELVLTSSWRDTYGVVETGRRLAHAGLKGRIADAVPALPHRSRSDEIDVYVATLKDADRYVILDDVPVARHLRSRLVLVDDFTGLSSADVELAARMLR